MDDRAAGQDMTKMDIVKSFVDSGGRVRWVATYEFNTNEDGRRRPCWDL